MSHGAKAGSCQPYFWGRLSGLCGPHTKKAEVGSAKRPPPCRLRRLRSRRADCRSAELRQVRDEAPLRSRPPLGPRARTPAAQSTRPRLKNSSATGSHVGVIPPQPALLRSQRCKAPKLKATSHGRRAVRLRFPPRGSRISKVLHGKQPRVFADIRTFQSSISVSSCAPRSGARVCGEPLQPRAELPLGS
jgi:hypothetical protein